MNSFDYIVVGGGTAGCVVAARLTESEATRVLLLEAGPADPLPRWPYRRPGPRCWVAQRTGVTHRRAGGDRDVGAVGPRTGARWIIGNQRDGVRAWTPVDYDAWAEGRRAGASTTCFRISSAARPPRAATPPYGVPVAR